MPNVKRDELGEVKEFAKAQRYGLGDVLFLLADGSLQTLRGPWTWNVRDLLAFLFWVQNGPNHCRKERKSLSSKMTSGEVKTSLKNVYSSAKRLSLKVEEEGEEEDYCTPGAFELERLFWKGSPQYTHVNEVWPKLYIGD
ncbi:hypothetical protein H8959_012014, partial [Pygathrix nigripes]